MSTKKLDQQIEPENQLQSEVAKLILEIIDINKEMTNTSIHESQFSGKKIPKISIELYIDRLKRYFNFEDNTLILTLIYLDRFCEFNSIKLKINNFHRLFLICLLVAIKYNEDLYYPNSFYAKIGGITLTDLNCMEENYLDLIEYSVFVEEELFNKYSKYLQNLNENR